MADPQKDEHIEELLSKLQGIFGKLSHAEEEESKSKVDARPVPKATPAATSPASTKEPTPVSGPAPAAPSTPTPEPKSKEVPAEPASAAYPTSTTPVVPPNSYQTLAPATDPEKLIVSTAVFFPGGKEAEAKSLAMKLEMMTPKFTKVAFRLRVIVFQTYDPKSDWKAAVVSKTSESACQTVFVVVDRPLDDGKKKAISSECEAKDIYFQDVPLGSIEKKAYYTDILLGLVFYFDSHRPPEKGDAA